MALLMDPVGACLFAAGLALAASSATNKWTLYAGLLLLGAILRATSAVLAAHFGARCARIAKAEARRVALDATLAAQVGARPGNGESVALFAEGVAALDPYFSRYAPRQAAAAAVPLLLTLAIGCVSPAAGLIILLTFLPLGLILALIGKSTADEGRRQLVALTRLSGLFVDRLRNLPVILAFQAEARATSELHAASVHLARRTIGILKISFLNSAALEFFAALCVALVAVYYGFALLGLLPFKPFEPISLGRGLFVLVLAPEVYLPLRRLAAAYHDRQAAMASAEKLMAFEAAAERPRPKRTIYGGSAPRVTLRDVTFRYASDLDPVMRGFNLALPAGETLAVVGPSGCGKSSILRLVLGLEVPHEGAVEIDGIPAHLTRIGVGYAAQTPVVLPGTLGENIALANPTLAERELFDIAKAVGLAERSEDLERRLDDRGGGLSGGERRRLAVARVLASDAPLLLLDEPTANLDSAAQEDLLRALRRYGAGKTILIATHSPKVMHFADRVVHLQEERVAA